MKLNTNKRSFLMSNILALCLLFIMSGCAVDSKIIFTFEPQLSTVFYFEEKDESTVGWHFYVSRVDKAVVEIKEKDGPVVKKIDLTDSFKKDQSESIEFTIKDITDYRRDKVYHLSAILNAEVTLVKGDNYNSAGKGVFEGTSELQRDFKFKPKAIHKFIADFSITPDWSASNIIPNLRIVSTSKFE